MRKLFYPVLLIILLATIIILIIGTTHLIASNGKFRTNFNLMFGYTKWGRDYAREIINEKYEGEEITFSYVRADINSGFDDDVIRPYLITFYFLTEEKSVTYLAWTDGDTYTIDWEKLQ